MVKNFIVIFVTCASRKEAKAIAKDILTKKLAACANIIDGVNSYFWWKGRIRNSQEVMVIMKTAGANFKKIEACVKRLHSYEVPEIIALPIVKGSRDYLDWIGRSIVY